MYIFQFVLFYRLRKPRYTPRILGRRFALTSTAYKYLDIGISVGPASFVELVLGDNRGNKIVLPHATWTTFIKRRADIEQFLQSTTASSLPIGDLVIELAAIRNESVIKLTLCDTCMYMKPQTVLFLFELEHCVEHVYIWLCQNIHSVNEKFKHFVNTLQQNCIIYKSDAIKILHKISDKNSPIDCELLAYAIDNIVYNGLYHE